MRKFDEIYDIAAKRKGGTETLETLIAEHNGHITPPNTDDRWLAQFTKSIFQAGFNWKVVEHMWAGFEEAFWGFDLDKCAQIDMDDMERLTGDTRIVRNGGKIKAVPVNAQMLLDMGDGSRRAGQVIMNWPEEDYIGLLSHLHKHGSRLGPRTAGYALRFCGKRNYILSGDVTAALIREGVIDKEPTTKAAKRAVQDAFSMWAEQSGRSHSEISRTLAFSVGV
ncbi:DNA-3-methyladenine glycosylase I [Robiginitomaculum antarcticum]|uniref:DNA-3-methyladenine glycosylase I n=1 Tax=Robiginitomaculum antarcticum TaxID=437507 RepID=UPI0003787FDC|nr:DNA-3-methyladenine glycosylase I [Robiginitomaculum antarcticum]